jgi:hypothetical protein
MTIQEAMLERASNPAFNSFNELGQFVDGLMLNAYNPDDLPKSMKLVASQAAKSKFLMDSQGNQVSVEDIVKEITKSGGVAATLKTNRDKVTTLSDYYESTASPQAINYLRGKAISDVYTRIANGEKFDQPITQVIEDYKDQVIAEFFYGSISDELGLTKSGSTGTGSKGPGAQKKYETTPVSMAIYKSGNMTGSFDLPTADGNVATQSYNAGPINQGSAIFNDPSVYFKGRGKKSDTDIEGEVVANNTKLKEVGLDNMQYMALADGTVLDDAVGLEKVTLHPNGSYHMVMAPVRRDPKGKGGWVPAFDLVASYSTVINQLRELYAAGEIKTQEDVELYLDASAMPEGISIKPFLAMDVILADNKDIDDRYLSSDGFELPEQITDDHEDAVGYNKGDKKIKIAKAYMVVDDPESITNLNIYKDQLGKFDAAASDILTGGEYERRVATQDIGTYDATPIRKEGGKAPSAEDIHKILFD